MDRSGRSRVVPNTCPTKSQKQSPPIFPRARISPTTTRGTKTEGQIGQLRCFEKIFVNGTLEKGSFVRSSLQCPRPLKLREPQLFENDSESYTPNLTLLKVCLLRFKGYVYRSPNSQSLHVTFHPPILLESHIPPG